MKKQWKSLSVDEKIYNLVSQKQAELVMVNGGKHIQIGLVAEMAILGGIDRVVLKDGIVASDVI